MPPVEARRPFRRRAFIALVLLGATGISVASYSQQAVPRDDITVEQAHSLARSGDIILVDIRRPDEWQRTGIPEFGVPIDMRRPDFIQAVAQAAADKPVALICARGVRSRRSIDQLLDAGILNVIDVPEGMLGSFAGAGWLKKNLPVETYEIED